MDETRHNDETEPNDDTYPNTVTAFISAKPDDEESAKGLQERLAILGGDRLKFLEAAEMPAGEKQREWVKKRLNEAKLLFFPCMSATGAWEKCLYQTGMFEGVTDEGKGRIIVLHSPGGKPPQELQHLQAVEATPSEMGRFLKKFFGDVKITGISPPLNPAFAKNDNEVQRVANEICKLFKAELPAPVKVYPRLFVLRVTDPATICDGKIPDDALVESGRPESFRIFNNMEDRPPDRETWTWADLREELQKTPDTQWVNVLGEEIENASKGRAPDPIPQTFSVVKGRKMYRPVIYSRDVQPNGAMAFRVLLIEEPIAVSVKGPPDLATLLTSLTLGNRLQWEVYERYAREMKDWKDEEQVKDGCKRISERIDNIEEEAEARKRADPSWREAGERLLYAFHEFPDERREIELNLERQRKIKEELKEKELSEANSVRELLEELKTLNLRLMDLASKRYQEIIHQLSERSYAHPSVNKEQ